MRGNAIRIAAVLVLFSLLLSGPARACFTTAQEYASWLQAYKRFDRGYEKQEHDFFHAGQASAFARAVHDMFSVEGKTCTPKSITVGDLMTVVSRHWAETMDQFDLLPSQTCAELVLRMILIKRFPCKPDPKPPAN